VTKVPDDGALVIAYPPICGRDDAPTYLALCRGGIMTELGWKVSAKKLWNWNLRRWNPSN
jgi:hypothetical protein